MKDSYVYIHINPIKNEIFYVGIGCTYHNNKPSRPYRTNRGKHWNNIVNKYGCQIEIIHTNLTWEQACENEKYYIKLIGRLDLKKGTLINKTDGGDGNYNPSEETRQKLRQGQLGRKFTHTKETCEKIAKSHLGSKRTDMQKRNISKSRLGIVFSDEQKIKMSLKAKLRIKPNFSGEHKDSTKEKIRQSLSNISLELKNQILIELDTLSVKEIAIKHSIKIGQIYHIRSKYKKLVN